MLPIPFDRNMLYIGVGYQFKNNFNLQLGYLGQTVGLYTKSYFQTSINYTFDLKKQKQ
jgi:hypothetical protein